jgi:cytochrome c oxidase cbb3-type subunit 4
MELYTTLSSIFTVLSFVLFIGIVAWAWSGRRRAEFAAAANEPFALPDESPRAGPRSHAGDEA